MSYNNNNSHYNNNGGGNNNYQNNNNNNNNASKKKHSGATKGIDKNGKQYFRGWNFSKRRGMLTVFVTAYKSSSEHTSPKSGITYTNLMAKLHYKDSGVEKIVGALLSHKTHRVIIPELGMVLNPDAPNKGYFGKFTRKK
jgi:hypothetical protein